VGQPISEKVKVTTADSLWLAQDDRQVGHEDQHRSGRARDGCHTADESNQVGLRRQWREIDRGRERVLKTDFVGGVMLPFHTIWVPSNAALPDETVSVPLINVRERGSVSVRCTLPVRLPLFFTAMK